jgi:hypothetical protein
MNRLSVIQKASEILPTLHGWCSIDKAKKLIEVIIDSQPEICVEIGVFGGSSLVPQILAIQHNKHGKVFGIDPWANDAALEEMIHEDHKKWWEELNLEDIYFGCKKNIATLGLEKFCILIRDKAENVASRFTDESIGLLHIDGNHSEALSYKDATLYLPKVKSGGFIFFDDIWWTENQQVTTRKAIVYLLEHCTRIDLLEDCMILQKN